tara:strand:+ start:9994 stop:10302 length:309 start_codon:yes stop_codon:yes gene_type:complete
MTELEKSSLDSFLDLLSHSGKTLLVGSKSVRALVELIEPEDATYSLENTEGQDAIVRVKKADFPLTHKRPGSLFSIEEDELNFRIKSTRLDTQFFIFRCEVY